MTAKRAALTASTSPVVIYELEFLAYHARRPKVQKVAAGLVMLTVAIAALTPQYRTLTSQLEHRFLESEGRSSEQIAAREAEQRRNEAEAKKEAEREAAEQQRLLDQARRAAEKQQQQQLAQQNAQSEQERLQKQYRDYVAKYREILADMSGALAVLQNINSYQASQSAAVKRQDFYSTYRITVEETASERACRDPGLFNSFDERFHNLFACHAYYSANKGAAELRPITYQLLTVAVQRSSDGSKIPYYQFGRVLQLVWGQIFNAELRSSMRRVALPELVSGTSLNTRILGGGDHIDGAFATMLLNTVTEDEKLNLRNVVYPQLKRLEETYSALTDTCRRLSAFPCLPPAN